MPRAQLERIATQEALEFVIKPPFAGVCSDLPIGDLEQVNGFYDAKNVVFRNGALFGYPGSENLVAAVAGGPVLCLADFFEVGGALTNLFIHDGGVAKSWTGTTTGNLGTVSTYVERYYTWDVVNYRIHFTNGATRVMYWNGAAATFTEDANAPFGLFLMELGFHLVVGHITGAPQRVVYSISGDGTTWTGTGSGTNNLLNNLGNITGMRKLKQQGFIFQENGITQMIPTGIAARPFDFRPFGDAGRGCQYPYTIASYGDRGVVYVNEENVWWFTGSDYVPIGSHRLEGTNTKVGAFTAILRDLYIHAGSRKDRPFGYVAYSSSGTKQAFYYLTIGNVTSEKIVWVYSFEDECWSRLVPATKITCIGRFHKNGDASLPTYPNEIGAPPGFSYSQTASMGRDSAQVIPTVLGFSDGSINGLEMADLPENAWHVSPGALSFGDKRHVKRIVGVNVVVRDTVKNGFAITLYNERGESSVLSSVTTAGTTGRDREFPLKANFSGLFFGVSIDSISDGGQVQHCGIVELRFKYIIGEDVRVNA